MNLRSEELEQRDPSDGNNVTRYVLPDGTPTPLGEELISSARENPQRVARIVQDLLHGRNPHNIRKREIYYLTRPNTSLHREATGGGLEDIYEVELGSRETPVPQGKILKKRRFWDYVRELGTRIGEEIDYYSSKK